MAKKRILLVDDSNTVLTFEKMMLRDEDYELFTARDGADVPDAIQAHQPDLILMDVMMPRRDGIQTCKLVKGDEQTKAIPIIMVTTKGNQPMVNEAYAAGCDDFVTKPIDKVELLAKIKNHLRQ